MGPKNPLWDYWIERTNLQLDINEVHCKGVLLFIKLTVFVDVGESPDLRQCTLREFRFHHLFLRDRSADLKESNQCCYMQGWNIVSSGVGSPPHRTKNFRNPGGRTLCASLRSWNERQGSRAECVFKSWEFMGRCKSRCRDPGAKPGGVYWSPLSTRLQTGTQRNLKKKLEM